MNFKSSKEQKEVIEAEYINHSPIIVVAGAGSWKTTTLINKIKYSIENQGINPKEICAISFTNKSAKNLKESLEKNNIKQVKSGTFHSIIVKILKKYFYNKNNINDIENPLVNNNKEITILDKTDEKSLLKKFFDKKYKAFLKEIELWLNSLYIKQEDFNSKKREVLNQLTSNTEIMEILSKAKNTGENPYEVMFFKWFVKREYKDIKIPSTYIPFDYYIFNEEEKEKWINYFNEKINLLKLKLDENKIKMDEKEYLYQKFLIDIKIKNLFLIKEVIYEFEEYKKENNYLTFDDILIDIVLKLKEDEWLRKVLDKEYKYILVDEFQDVNYIQVEFLKLLNKDFNYLIVVWDSDQAIYSFRWCHKYYFNNFDEIFPNRRIFFLSDNYRSDWNIVRIANISIKNNKNRYNKIMQPINPFFNKIEILNDFEELNLINTKIIPTIKRLLNQKDKNWNVKYKYSDIAVLYRNNYMNMKIQSSFASNNIPFNVVGWMSFFEKKIVKDIRSFLENIEKISPIHLERILKLLPKVWEVKAQKIIAEIEAKNNYKEKIFVLSKYSETQRLYIILNEIFLEREKSKNNTTFYFEPIISFIHKFYNNILKEIIDNSNITFEEKERFNNDYIDFINIIVEIWKVKSLNSINDLLEVLVLEEEDDNKLLTEENKKEKNNKITLSTIHRAKWLEWKIVFMIWLKQWELPSKKVLEMNPKEFKEEFLEEERNLFYVGLTRAREHLFLAVIDDLMCSQSQFIDEIIDYI